MTEAECAFLDRGDGHQVAYVRHSGASPGVVFLHGLKSDMEGGKALALEAHCRARGQAFLRLDTFGHGRSSGTFEEGTIGRWRADVTAALDHLTEGPQVIVGSSMGGWLMLLALLDRPEKAVAGLGLAAAPDFTEDLLEPGLSADQRAELKRDGLVHLPNCYGADPYPIALKLIEEGRDHLLLRGPLPITQPLRLIHGMKDADVPWRTALRIMEQVSGDDVECLFAKNGEHRLSEPADLKRLCHLLDTLLDHVAPHAPGEDSEG
ncbi:alpha/beta hydrolase [Roseospirillum parvum]|uniref:Alpha/beta hydrolase family protein n=1 Tax=Roseospirillum parvum TaxID=83401 RepID=A0A1G7ZIV6_9PROT|nr:alpha/beta hydrolase [Roseospirillum parvum]SDH08507.1 Alpha/beta hydrolase family protein [Roseospirillum parvum]